MPAFITFVDNSIGFLQQGKFRVIISGRRVVVADDILYDLSLLRRKSEGLEDFGRSGRAVLFLGLPIVIPKLLLRHPYAHVMQKGAGNHDVGVASRILIRQTIGMVQHPQGMLNPPVIVSEELQKGTRDSRA